MSSTGEGAHPDNGASAVHGAELDSVLGMAPGPAAMVALTEIDVAGLDAHARVAVAAAWERQQAWVAAQAQASLSAVTADVPGLPAREQEDALQLRHGLVSAALRWSPVSTGRRLVVAQQLMEELADTRALLDAGQISFRHAWVLAEAVGGLTPDEIAFVQSRVLERAPGQTVAAFTRCVRRAVIAASPELAAARREEVKRDRRVICRDLPEGMAELVATMPAEDAETVFEALTAVARQAEAAAKAEAEAAAKAEAEAAASAGAGASASAGAGASGNARASAGAGAGGPQLPLGARRADALLGWAQQALAEPDLPRRQGRRVELQVVIDLPTLLGLADNPSEIAGYGPIPAAVARELAADASWRRLVVDPVDGHLLDYGTQVYRPPQKLVDYLVARDRRCRFPGCSMRADACDLDHVIPYGTPEGITAASNMAALCRRHHRLKTHGGWQLQMHKNGALTWTAPGGRQYDLDPHDQIDWAGSCVA